MNTKQKLLLASVAAVPLCLIMLAFAERVMRWKWFQFHNCVVFLGGYLVNHNPHQPSPTGMIVAEYAFWFGVVLMVLSVSAMLRKLRHAGKGRKSQPWEKQGSGRASADEDADPGKS